MDDARRDVAGAPIIPRLSGKIAALERRAEYLAGELKRGGRSETALAYSRAELSAIEAAVLALKYHRAEIDALDTPILALSDLADAVAAVAFEQPAEVREALDRSRKVLADWKA